MQYVRFVGGVLHNRHVPFPADKIGDLPVGWCVPVYNTKHEVLKWGTHTNKPVYRADEYRLAWLITTVFHTSFYEYHLRTE